MNKPPIDELLHYGIKRRSGRYPWGSGEDPLQGDNKSLKFLREYEELLGQGMKATDIAAKLGMNTTQLRNNIMWARDEERTIRREQATKMHAEGLSNVAIAEKLGISEGSVRNYISEDKKYDSIRKDNINEAIVNGVNQSGYLDVGTGVERQIGVSRTAFNAEVNRLVEQEGYHIHEVYTRRLSDPSKWTTVKVLTKESDIEIVKQNSDNIKHLNSQSDDFGQTVSLIKKPNMLDMDRIHIRYAEDGGADKDGLLELRRGVDDLDLGNAKYAQVRVGAGEDRYLKGMAAYSDDKFPPGVDIIFNTNKTKDVSKEDVLKKMKVNPKDTDDPNEMFGTNITKQKGSLNIVNEEGDWDKWSTKMSSQFLSKQPASLIKDRLDATFGSLKSEFDEINSLTNPVVKKHLMDKYIESLDSKAQHLKAQGLPNTKNHVLLPITDIKPNEIYAPNYKNGDRVVLVRHPHGGIFEIPDLVVNNRNETASKMIGNKSRDAVGIHPSVAEKLSGADFDGDTALVIPNNKGQIKTARSLKELKGWADEMHVLYKRDHKTIAPRTKQIQMGVVSNLITDMTIKDASFSELARAVKHSMVVIDSEKHNLDYKQSARDNSITALRKKYQSHTDPDTGKASKGAATLISRSKGDLVDPTTKSKSSKINISDPNFDPGKYSSGTAKEALYVDYIKNLQSIKKTATSVSQSIPRPQYSKEAAKVYQPEIQSLNAKLNTALLNKPRERQAQLMTNSLFYKNRKPDMDPDAEKKLKTRSLAQARAATGAKKALIDITDREWEAIQARAISSTKLDQILNNADIDKVKKLATPKQVKMTSAKATRAKSLLDRGYTYAEVAQQMGVSTSTIRDAIKEGE